MNVFTILKEAGDRAGWNDDSRCAICLYFLNSLVDRGIITTTDFAAHVAEYEAMEETGDN